MCVGRNGSLPGWLGGTYICTKDFSVRVLICKFNGPYAGASSEVQYPTLYLISDGGEVELVTEANCEHLVGHVEALEFFLELEMRQLLDALHLRGLNTSSLGITYAVLRNQRR